MMYWIVTHRSPSKEEPPTSTRRSILVGPVTDGEALELFRKHSDDVVISAKCCSALQIIVGENNT